MVHGSAPTRRRARRGPLILVGVSILLAVAAVADAIARQGIDPEAPPAPELDPDAGRRWDAAPESLGRRRASL